MKKIKFLYYLVITIIMVVIMNIVYIVYRSRSTNMAIANYRTNILSMAHTYKKQFPEDSVLKTLPAPVVRYFNFVFQDKERSLPQTVSFEMNGIFRRPQKEIFHPTTARQILTTGEPALIFDARAQMPLNMWAHAFDFYARGEMLMKAQILSAYTVVDETSTAALNQTSLQRWLLESSVNPAALLPGGAVHWEPVNDAQARAVVSAHGYKATLLATFRADGSLEKFEAEEDGDLQTPYHGSGEYVLREDYQLFNGIMVPMKFTIARSAQSKIYPFWIGRITDISFSY